MRKAALKVLYPDVVILTPSHPAYGSHSQRPFRVQMDIGDDDPYNMYTPEMAKHFRKGMKAASKQKEAAPPVSEDDAMDVDDDNIQATPKAKKRVTGRAAVEAARTRLSEDVNKGKRKTAPSLPNTPRYAHQLRHGCSANLVR